MGIAGWWVGFEEVLNGSPGRDLSLEVVLVATPESDKTQHRAFVASVLPNTCHPSNSARLYSQPFHKPSSQAALSCVACYTR